MQRDHILVHYGEIALKGKNRNYFESRLVQNIKIQLEAFAPGSFDEINNIFGGILIKLNKKGIKNKLKIEDALMHTFGITNFSFTVSVSQDIETLKKVCWDLVSKEKFKTFCVRTQRSNKQFKLTSQQINEEVGGYISEKLNGKKSVNLKNPDCECFIYIIN